MDEFGPVEVRPQAGAAWAPKKRPVRRRANYRRPHGVRYFYGGYDVHQDKLWMHHKKRKRRLEFMEFLRSIRERYKDGRRIYLVLDNLSTHKGDQVFRWCKANNIVLVFTATYASWMNRIECHFAAVKEFVICNSDYPDHAALAKAMQEYLCWRNKNTKAKKLLKAQKSIPTL